jgi:hypothetical protein
MCQAMQNVKHPSYLSYLDTSGLVVHASRMEIYSSTWKLSVLKIIIIIIIIGYE